MTRAPARGRTVLGCKTCKVAGAGQVAVFSNPGDEAWSAVLTADLVSHGVPAIDAARSGLAVALEGATGIVVVVGRSGPDGPGLPSDDQVADVTQRGGALIVARAVAAKMPRDRRFLGRPTLALWEHYYQPGPARAGRVASGGWANLLRAFTGDRKRSATPTDYVFISYRHDHDGTFVRDQLRGVLALGGFATWDYRATERIEDSHHAVSRRLIDMIAGASAVVVVGTSNWPNEWTTLELAAATCLQKPVVIVRPSGKRPVKLPDVTALSTEVLDRQQWTAPATIAALVAAGAHRTIPPHKPTQPPP